jgi:hypothetical protein
MSFPESFSDEHRSIVAIEAALEWMLFRLVSTAQDPKSVLNDFSQHMLDRAKLIEEFGLKAMMDGETETFVSATDTVEALNKLREDLIKSVIIDP